MSSIKMNSSTTFRNILIALALLLLIALGISLRKNSNLKTDLNISEQNQKALTDSVRVSKNKVGELEYSKNILISKNGDLSKLNADLAAEYAKEKGKVSELTKTIAIIKNNPKDTIFLPTDLIKYPDGTKGLAWTYDTIYSKDNYRKVKGVSDFKIDFTNATYTITPLKTKISEFEIGFDFVQGLRETKAGDVEMFVRSNHPGFDVKDLDAVIINPDTHPVLKKFTNKTKQKRFGIGVIAGYGIYIDNFNRTSGLGAQVGVGFSYSLINF